MTDFNTTKTHDEMTSSSEDSFAWTEPEQSGNTAGQQAREWLTQLQAMIENLATQAAPVVREVGAKAAELAAVAGEKAGPVAQRAAVLTGQAGHKLAEKSRDFAADLRRDAAAAKASTTAEADVVADVTSEPANADEPMASGVA